MFVGFFQVALGHFPTKGSKTLPIDIPLYMYMY